MNIVYKEIDVDIENVILSQYSDGFIEVIEVAKEYRRQGIGSTLVKMLKEFAGDYIEHFSNKVH